LSSRSDTIHGAVLDAALRHPDRAALRFREGGAYRTMTYADLARLVAQAAGDLEARGIGRGDVVGIASGNGPRWTVVDLAALSIGAVVVPIYPTLPPPQLSHILRDSRMRLLFVGRGHPERAAREARPAMSSLEDVVPLNDVSLESDRDRAPVSAGTVSGDDIATICYTSGTTGTPRGVMLTHRNLTSNAWALIDRFDITEHDSTVSYLPQAHMFERTCGHNVFLFSGGTVAYAESRASAIRDIGAVRPTVLIAVPRVLERAYETAVAKVELGPWLTKGLVQRAFTLLNERSNRRYQGNPVSPWLAFRCALYDRFIASKFRRIGGGRLRLVVSGGAGLDRRIGKALLVFGFPVVEGYGLTEASPVVSCGLVGRHRLGTVGPPLDGIEVAFSSEGEILARGPSIMRGYLGRPEDTAAAVDRDGWLHTGDLGELDDDGNLVVTGRMKDIIVTSYGKNIMPGPIEERLAVSPLVEQAIVLGDNRKALVAVIVPHREEVLRLTGAREADGAAFGELVRDDAVRKAARSAVARANEEGASYERIVSFLLAPEGFTVENGLLTPTLKLRRRAITDRYADDVESLYRSLEGRHADTR
jgi:long-chain acyl-CoA synthetase